MVENTLLISDSNSIAEAMLFDQFYATPADAQEKCRKIFTDIMNRSINFYSIEGLLDTTINRYFLADIKLLEHCLIAENIVSYCSKHEIKEIKLLVSNQNKSFASFYNTVLQNKGLTVGIEFHSSEIFWSNSLTDSSTKEQITGFFKFWAVGLGQFCLLLVNFILSPFKKTIPPTKLVLWHSFANNREKVDFRLLDNWHTKESFSVIHPNPYAYKSRGWDKPIYFLGKYSLNPFLFLKVLVGFIGFKKKFNTWMKEVTGGNMIFPEEWNTTSLMKTRYFLLYNLLSGGLIENLSKKYQGKAIHIFRGGAAAGLIYTGICQKRYGKTNSSSILVTHGTEFNIIDHFSYFYLNYNILPSEPIKRNWENQLNEYQHLQPFNNCTLLNGGRIDYELLDTSVNKKPFDPKKVNIGIVLTYNTQTYQDKYICDIIDLFNKAFPGTEINYVIKPRSNFGLSLDAPFKKTDKISIAKGDIFSFLSDVDLIIGTVSTYGILTMVVTDAIYCDIPGFYYMPNSKFNETNLGYSYHPSMRNYIYNSSQVLEDKLSAYATIEKFIRSVGESNRETRPYLKTEVNPTTYLTELINSL